MLKIGQILNDNDLLLQVYRLRATWRSSAKKQRLGKRKNNCYDIDSTYKHNQPNGSQGGVGYCYGFATAGILNNALGIDNINPLYLHILNISARSIDYDLNDEGGINKFTAAESKWKLKTYYIATSDY